MKCRRCGFENVDNADFCCHCGEDLRQMNWLEYQNNLRDPNEQMNQNYQQNFNYQQNQSFRQEQNFQQGMNYNAKDGGEDGMAVASMVCGICALLMMCCVPYFTLVMAILGLVFGILSLKKKSGNGMALTGVITSCISLAFSVIGILMGLSLLLNV